MLKKIIKSNVLVENLIKIDCKSHTIKLSTFLKSHDISDLSSNV